MYPPAMAEIQNCRLFVGRIYSCTHGFVSQDAWASEMPSVPRVRDCSRYYKIYRAQQKMRDVANGVPPWGICFASLTAIVLDDTIGTTMVFSLLPLFSNRVGDAASTTRIIAFGRS